MPLLPGRAKFRQDELLKRRNDFASFLAVAWLWTPQSQEPLALRKWPQIQLGAAKARF